MTWAPPARVRETTTTTGTGTYSLAGAVAGYRTFVAGVGDAAECVYCATDGTDWEVGIGTVTDAAPDTLSRDTILGSSNAGAAVDWAAGTRQVFVWWMRHGAEHDPGGDDALAGYLAKSGQRLALLDPTHSVTPTDLACVAFTSGGAYEIVAGDVITGATSAKTATVWLVYKTSGTWAGGDAAGWLFVSGANGAFSSENLNVGANNNVATIGGDLTPNLATWDARAQIPVFDFDATTPEVAWLQGHMDYSYAGSGINVVLHVTMTSATSDTVGWLIAFRRIGNGSQDVDLTTSWTTHKTVTAETVPGTAGYVLIHAALAFSNGAEMDSIAAGEIFQIAIIRDTPNDTATGDAELVLCEIREQ